jgi:hypothetical protein
MGDFEDNKTNFTDENTASYNTAFFAIKARKEDVFSEESMERFKKYMPALSMLDDRVMLLPAGQLEPSFYYPNKIFFKSFMGRHRDCEMPVVMCVSNTSLGGVYDTIYGDDSAADATADAVKSLESHTTTPFSGEMPEKTDVSGYLEGSLSDDEVLLVYGNILDLIHRLANDDLSVKFTMETQCSDVTLGPLSIKAISIFTGDKKSAERYTPIKETAAGPMTMTTGRALMTEFRHLVRMSLKFGKGDTGTSRDEETDKLDKKFESNMLTLITKNPPPAGPGALGLVAGYFNLMGLTNTVVKTGRKYDIDTDHSAVWSMFAQSNLGSMSAMAVSYVTVKDKGLKCHTKSANPLTNLQMTASRESRTYCGLVLYLAKRTCMSRCPKSTVTSVINRSKQCDDCNSGENCAMAWACVMTDSSALNSSLTDAKKRSMDGPSSSRFDQVFVCEYNDQASPLGSVGSSGAGQTRAGKGFIEAHKKAMDSLRTALRVNKDGSSKEAVFELGNALIKAQGYISGSEHRVPLMTRGECVGTKMETALTDSDGGVPKMSLGMMSMPLSRSKVLTYLMRIATNCNFKMAEFAAKPSQGLTDATSAIASKNIGVYSAKKDQDQVSVKAFYLHPSVQQDTDEVYDVNTEPKTAVISVPGVNVKTTNKYKMLNGIMKAADDCSTSYGGGMDFGATAPPITNAQRASLRSTVNWILLKAKPNFSCKAVQKSIDNLIDSVMAQPLGLFNNNELVVWDWDTLLGLFVMGSMMIANGFLVKANNYFDGMTVPKFAMMVNSSKVEMEPVSQRFLATGPTLVYARTSVDFFVGKASGEATRFVTCSMNKFNALKQLVGGNMLSLNNTMMTGVYLPLKSNYKGGYIGFDVDETCREISSMGELSPVERCESVSRNAAAFVAKIREINGLEDTDEVTFDHVYELFEQYSAQVLLDDRDMADMAQHITDSDYVSKVCQKVASRQREEEEAEEDEGDGVDFNVILNKTTMPASGSMGMDGDTTAASMAEFVDN